MKAGFLQYNVKHGDKKKNIDKIMHMLKENGGVFVLPELCCTGYIFETKAELFNLSEDIPGGETVNALAELSYQRHCTIIAGIAEREQDMIYNSAAVISEGKYIGKYRKIHLSDYEKTLFSRGDEAGIFEIDGASIGVQICFDLWFPEVSRTQVMGGADILCVLANFGGGTTPKIARVRAIENQTPLVLCNRVGSEKAGAIEADFLGNSMVIDKDGDLLCPEIKGEEAAFSAEVPASKIKRNAICNDFLWEMSIHYEDKAADK